MKKKSSDNIKTILITLVIILATRIIKGLPWWSFVVPLLAFGLLITIKQWKVASFWVGFLCGFVVWSGANLYFDLTLKGNILPRIGLLISVPGIVIILMAGVIGGVLTGLALYTGKSIIKGKEAGLTP